MPTTPAAKAGHTTFMLQTFPDEGEGPRVFFDGTEAQAIQKALTRAKNDQHPVDLRWPQGADEDAQFIGTASPSEFHAKGARFSRSEMRG